MHSRFVPDEALTREAVALAASLLQQAQRYMTRQEKRQAATIAGMLADPHGKTLTTTMVEQAFRSHPPTRIADQIRYVLGAYGLFDFSSLRPNGVCQRDSTKYTSLVPECWRHDVGIELVVKFWDLDVVVEPLAHLLP